MRAEQGMAGGRTLLFERALEAPWKLFHVDPPGPFGGQTKVAAVITLPEASWEALDRERAAHADRARQRHADWSPRARRKPELDGSFAFIVIGPGEGRFNVQTDGGGRVLRVENRMTDRWLGGDFDRFIDTWGAEGASVDAPSGYWFWNRGETEPFSWEPGTYRALAAALELLGEPPGDGRDYFAAAARVLESLAAAGGGRGLSLVEPLPLASRETILPGGETVVESESKNAAATVSRRIVLSAGRVVTDRLRLGLDEPRRSFHLTIGYEAVASRR